MNPSLKEYCVHLKFVSWSFLGHFCISDSVFFCFVLFCFFLFMTWISTLRKRAKPIQTECSDSIFTSSVTAFCIFFWMFLLWRMRTYFLFSLVVVLGELTEYFRKAEGRGLLTFFYLTSLIPFWEPCICFKICPILDRLSQ